MEAEKYGTKILNLIKSSLSYQELSNKIIPEGLIETRDRYYLIQCRVKNKSVNCLFLRYDQWFFYLHGLNKLPETIERREYKSKVRIKIDDSEKQKNKKLLLEKRIQTAEKLIKEIDNKLKE